MNISASYIGFDYASAGIVAEINRNIETLFSTPEGTCPGDRAFGLKQNLVDMPVPVVQNQIALDITEKIELYEPRVEARDISFVHDTNGNLTVNVLFRANSRYMGG